MNQVKNLSLAATNEHQLAMQHLALHNTKVALARWSSGHTWSDMQLALALKPSCQTQWHSAAQENFKSWLAAGGFASDNDTAAPLHNFKHASVLETTHEV